ncbi:hypothetical protein LZ30DRAFT_428958 [Colletotrichum cereale]|nr:hypothetical protein LZ30DRAFT_428958 [Colletotrichum cereale]
MQYAPRHPQRTRPRWMQVSVNLVGRLVYCMQLISRVVLHGTGGYTPLPTPPLVPPHPQKTAASTGIASLLVQLIPSMAILLGKGSRIEKPKFPITTARYSTATTTTLVSVPLPPLQQLPNYLGRQNSDATYMDFGALPVRVRKSECLWPGSVFDCPEDVVRCHPHGVRLDIGMIGATLRLRW